MASGYVSKMVNVAVAAGCSLIIFCAASAQEAAPKPAAFTKTVHWAYQPVIAAARPAVRQQAWVRQPIDAFVLAKIEQAGLKPSLETDRATFIRRATLDTLGFVPTPQEVDAFVKDKSPDAYEKLVDRLLASEHYGERQARRWLDLARYADSTGFQNDNNRLNSWRYRDYVINAFNGDKPYDQFIREQLAGDEIAPNSKEALIATGFLTQYPDNHNARDLVQRRYQIITNITDTVGEVFLAQTVACARCHDHKFDKISEKEYFQLQSFFANIHEVNDIQADIGPEEQAFQKEQAVYDQATREIRAKRKAIIDSIREEGRRYYAERYLADARKSIFRNGENGEFKPESDWSALDRWMQHRVQNVTSDGNIADYLKDTSSPADPHYNPASKAKWDEYERLGKELDKYDDLKPNKGSVKISAMTELGHADAPKTFFNIGGNHERPDYEVQPAFPVAIAGNATPKIVPTASSSGRRTALANWIASSENPLTARVYVNRIWNEYFGRGIVSTVSDFGKAGARPTNPELLDYLAAEFVRGGWHVKPLHRQILLSATYRQSSSEREDAWKVDPDNKLLAVFPRRRLEAEQIRDSLLVAAGELNPKVGGPSVFAPIPAALNAGKLWPVSKDQADWNRRSLYIFTRRSVAYPLLETFDMASPQQVHSQRSVTTTPLQALTLYNSDTVFGWSQRLAGRVIEEAGNDESRQLDLLYEVLFARKPDKQERETLHGFLRAHEQTLKSHVVDGKLALAEPIGVKNPAALDLVRASAFVDLVHTVANSNDFSYRF